MNSRMILAMCVFLAGPALAQEVERDTTAFAEIIFGRGAKARQTLRIVDDDGNSVTGAKVQMSFVMPGCQWIHGQSDSNGLFAAEGQSGGEVNYHIEKDGYYPSRDTLNIGNKDGVVIKDGLWQPWNPEVRVVLRCIIKPIPMYARKVETKIPEIGKPLGFDLVVSDWVEPYGKGIHSDVRISMTRQVESIDSYEGCLVIDFEPPFGGIQTDQGVQHQSVFQSSRFAMTEGYSSWSNRFGYGSSQGYFGRDTEALQAHQIMRIRPVMSDTGELLHSMYGKMAGGFKIRGIARPDLPIISFTYYLNPTPNDRNMEFDPKRNLFKNLKSTEEVTAP